MNRRSPRRPMYAACITKPHGNSRWMLKFHSCTVGKFMWGSKTVIGGALLLVCRTGVKNVDGLTEGGGSWVGNPPATVLLTFGEFTQPFVIVAKGKVVVQLCTSPGTLPAAAVTW